MALLLNQDLVQHSQDGTQLNRSNMCAKLRVYHTQRGCRNNSWNASTAEIPCKVRDSQ